MRGGESHFGERGGAPSAVARSTGDTQAAVAKATRDAVSGVEVAIVAFRNWELTRGCLEHLRRQTVAHRVVVCDNGCDRETAGRLAREFPEVTVVRLERNMAFAVACNAAVAATAAELVVIMNNDVNVRPDFLERLLAPFAERPRLGSVAPLLLRPGELQIDGAGLVADSTLAGFPRLRGLPPAAALAGGPVLTGPTGTAAAFRRAAWMQVGGLDEAIFAYLEDLDLALRLRAAGWETALALDAVAVHLGSATFGHRSAEQRRKTGHARAYLLRRYGVLRSRRAARALATEAIVVAGDAFYARDLAALRGRFEGWRTAKGCTPCARPPADALDAGIGFFDSLRLRRGIYLGRAPGRPSVAGLRSAPTQKQLGPKIMN
jgi:N-acetylglucosaminyl-diphospho-decaprenol L-rhamnosyltransferase